MNFKFKAKLLRKVSNSSELEESLKKAVKALSRSGVPSLVVGGYAIQEHGYARFTADLDLIVPNVQVAREILSINGFKENPGSNMTLTDRETKVEIDLLPGGGKVDKRAPLSLPQPKEVTKEPNIVGLRELIEMKLSSAMGIPNRNLKDSADVGELIRSNKLPVTFDVDSIVQGKYTEIWNMINEI